MFWRREIAFPQISVLCVLPSQSFFFFLRLTLCQLSRVAQELGKKSNVKSFTLVGVWGVRRGVASEGVGGGCRWRGLRFAFQNV